MSGQIAIVTGASSGIGKAIALELATHGVNLCLVGRNLETLEVVAEKVQTITPQVRCYQADLTQDQDIHILTTSLQRDFEHFDMLIHSAGVISQGRLEAAPVAEFDRQYRINVRAPYALTQALLPNLRLCQGQIVFINSSVGLVNGKENLGQYTATKHALKAIADSLRQEINTEGLRVLSVYPGRTATPMQVAVHKIEGKGYYPERLIQPKDVATVVINALSLPRTVEVTDINIRPLIKPN